MAIRTEWGIRDAKDEICSRLSIFHDDTTALSSENLKLRSGIYELLAKLGLISDRMSVSSSADHRQRTNRDHVFSSSTEISNDPYNHISSTADENRYLIIPPSCNCSRETAADQPYSYYSGCMWGFEFQFTQTTPGTHKETCRFFELKRRPSRTIRVQVPFLLGHLIHRINRACIEYTVGTGCPGISLHFKHIVPRFQSELA